MRPAGGAAPDARPAGPAFDYALPPERIAQEPVSPRDAARLMVLTRRGGTPALSHRRVRDLPRLLAPGDLLVVNDTRVLPARLAARRATGGAVEVVLIRPRDGGNLWRAIVKSRGRVKPGDRLVVGEAVLRVVSHAGADWDVAIDGADAFALMARHGKAPLPPYIKRPLADDPRREEDLARYQTVFARRPGAVAAPTAGLHFTPRLLAALAARGVRRAAVTLHVGPGTFRTAAGAPPDPERYAVPEATRRAIGSARRDKGRVVAVGTTAARALETWARTGRAEGWTDLVIRPGDEFLAVDALMTNFHLPGTSLLTLVSAFAGSERVAAAYAEALRRRYRFYSYGDAMLIL